MIVKSRDWKFRAAVTLSGLFLIAALASGLFLISGSYFPDVALPAAVDATQGNQNTVILWPAALLTMAVALFLFARWVYLRNISMWPMAGCPSCPTGQLVRVRRSAADRVLALSGIPTGRYRCMTCRWQGRRVPRGPVHLANMIGAQESTAELEAMVSSLQKSSSLDAQQPNLQTVPVSTQAEGAGSSPAQRPANAAFSTAGLNAHTAPVHRPALTGQKGDAGMAGPLGLKLRETPHVQDTPISTIEPDAAVAILERVKGEDGRTWQLVQADGRKGWVIGMFVKE